MKGTQDIQPAATDTADTTGTVGPAEQSQSTEPVPTVAVPPAPAAPSSTAHVVVADAGDDALAVLSDFANVNQIDAAQFSAVGAFQRATIGWYDRDRQDYRAIEVDEPSEVLSLLGDITLGAGGPEVRARVVLGLADGTTRGGHLLASTIWPTLEVTLRETATEPREWIETLGPNRPDHGIALVPSRSLEPAFTAPTPVAPALVGRPEPVAVVTATRGPGLRARSAAIICGLALILLGAWGALAPFIGPSFDFGFSPDGTWQWTSARGWLEVLPGCVAAVGGLVMMISPNRLVISLGGTLAALAGGWFIAGPSLADLLKIGSPGAPLGSRPGIQSLESLALFYGLGAVIVLLVAFVVGRVSARAFAPAPPKAVRPTSPATAEAAAVRSEPVHEQRWEPTAVAAH